MSPFIRKVRTASGATAVQIAVKDGRRDKVVEHLGSAHDEAGLAALLEVARARLHPGQLALDLEGGGRGGAVVDSKRSAVLWEVLTGAYEFLGLGGATGGDEAFKQMVLARLVEPTSKEQVPRVIGELGIQPVSRRSLFRCLARCIERDWRERIAAACLSHVTTGGGDLSLCLYDVTTLYFETDKEDDLRRVGYSKERRVDPQIIVGLLVDRSGFPLRVACWEGNRAETSTLVPVIEDFRARAGIEHLVIVADAGMLSATNLEALDAAGLGFIVGSRMTKAPGDLEAHFRWHGDAFVDGQVIDTITPRRGATSKERDTGLREEPVWDPREYPGSWRAVWAYSSRRFARDNKTLTAQENKARAVIDGQKTARRPRFVKGSAAGLSLDEAALARARRLAGLKGYVTNIPASTMEAGEVIASYHELWHVEQSFRMSFRDLKARPVFHHTRDAIEAHLTIVTAALAVARHLQATTGISIKRLVQELKPLQEVTISVNGHLITADPVMTPQAKRIVNSLKSLAH